MNTGDAVYTGARYTTDYRPEKFIYQSDRRRHHAVGYDSVAALLLRGIQVLF